MNMKSRNLLLFIGAIVLIIILIVVNKQKNETGENNKTSLVPIRIGWQISWVPQAQIAEVLKNTNILEQNGLSGELTRFNYGGPLAEAALADEMDVIFVGSGPALSIISKNDNWRIVSLMEDYRNAIIVPPSSTFTNLNDLRGKVIASPFGSTPYILAAVYLDKAGLVGKEINLKHVDVLEQNSIIQKGTAEKWGEIDAITAWDPLLAQFELSNQARILELMPDAGVVVMNKKFYEQHGKETTNFIKSIVESYNYYLKNKDMVDGWYLDDTHVNFTKEVINQSLMIDRNSKAQSIEQLEFTLTDKDKEHIQAEADKAFALNILKKQMVANDIIDLTFLEEAKKQISQGGYLKDIQIRK